MEYLFVAADNLITAEDIVNQQNGATITNATVSVTIHALDGTTAINGAGPITMTWSVANQRYEGVLPSTASLVEGRTYYIDISVSGSGTLPVRLTAFAIRYPG